MSDPGQPASDCDRPPVRVVLRPVATPLALGLCALAVASFAVSGLELSWIDPVTNSTTVGLAVLSFAVPLQALSAVIGFLSRDPVAGTGLGLLAGTWLAIGATTYTAAPASTSPALGLLLVAAAVALLVPAVAATSGKMTAAAVLVMAAVRFAVTGGYELTGAAGWQAAAGVCGLALSTLAIYAAMAFELEGVHGRAVIPVGRRRSAQAAMSSPFAAEIGELQHEAGVRKEL